MNDLIEKLKQKDYVRAFGLMSKEEQECYEKVAPENCLYYSHSNSWKAVWAFNDHQTFAIKPDYQPEPETEDIEIIAITFADHKAYGIEVESRS